MNLRTMRACGIAALGGLSLVFLLFLPVWALGAPSTPTPASPKEATPTPVVKPSGPRPAAPAIAPGVDFSLSSYAARGTHPGETATFTVLAVNAGASPATAAEVRTNVPANTTYVPNSAQVQGGGTLTFGGGALLWTGSVASGGSITITYRVVLPSAVGAVVSANATLYDPGAIALTSLDTHLSIQAPAGGPDDAGYTYKDSLAPASGVTFSWVPTTTPASKLNFGVLPADDVVTGPVDIGFAFQLYSGTYTQTYINTNGLVMFGASNAHNTDNTPSPIPNLLDSKNFASCLWSDMIVQTGEHGVWVEHYGSAPNRTTVITFREPYWSIPNTAPALFQMILSETSNRIKCQYLETAGPIYNSGGFAGIGLENIDGTVGLQYFIGDFNSSSLQVGPIEDHLAIEFTPGPPALPIFTTSAMDVSYNVHPGDVATYTLHARNSGNANGAATSLDNPIPPGTQYVPGSAQVQGGGSLTGSGAGVHWSGSVPAGQAVTVTFRLTVPTTLGVVFTDTATVTDPQAARPTVIHNPYLMRVLPAPTGGPDAFGYTYRDSFAPGTPVTFSWVPTTTPTSKLSFGAVISPDDVVTGPVPIGFAFNFYGGTYTRTFVSTNGLVSFGNGSDANVNAPIPTPGGQIDNYASCFWNDLFENDASQGVWVKTHGVAPNRFAVITFRTAYFSAQAAPPAQFQMILYESSNQIKCQYLDMPGPLDASGGVGATVGLENADGTSGVQYFFDPEFSQPYSVGPLEPGLAILFQPGPAVPVFAASIKTVAPLMHPGEIVTYTLSVVNDGPVPSTVSTVDDPIPPGATYVNGSAQVQGGGLLTANGANVQWAGTVAASQHITITFAVNLPAAAGLTNTATISDPHAILPIIRTAFTPIQPSAGLGVGRPSYAYLDSYSPGVAYSWVLTTGASSQMSITVGDTDDGFGPVPLGFAFKFFDRTYTSTLVSTNGLVMFNSNGSTTNVSMPIPTAGVVDNFATCFWDDQKVVTPATEGIWYETMGLAPHRRAVITFVLRDANIGSAPPYMYQMILREDDGSILCQYADVSGSPFGDGRQASIGVEGRYGDAGGRYFTARNHAPFIGPVEDKLAILFLPQKNVFLPIVDR